jgi:hypothetical protein
VWLGNAAHPTAAVFLGWVLTVVDLRQPRPPYMSPGPWTSPSRSETLVEGDEDLAERRYMCLPPPTSPAGSGHGSGGATTLKGWVDEADRRATTMAGLNGWLTVLLEEEVSIARAGTPYTLRARRH